MYSHSLLLQRGIGITLQKGNISSCGNISPRWCYQTELGSLVLTRGCSEEKYSICCRAKQGEWAAHAQKIRTWTSLVVQWLRIGLPMQGTQVSAQEYPTCHGATRPVRHNYWACTLEPTSRNYWALMPQLLKPVCLEPVLRNKRSHRN